jgi:hypothetical protein
MMSAKKLLMKEYKQNSNTFDYMSCFERVTNRCLQIVFHYVLTGYTYVCEYMKPSQSINDTNYDNKREIEYIRDQLPIVHDTINDLYRVVYKGENHESVSIEKLEKYPFLFIVLNYGEDESLDIFKEVRKYLVKGNIFNRGLLLHILHRHFSKEMERITDFDISILNKEVTFQTLPHDFSFQL